MFSFISSEVNPDFIRAEMDPFTNQLKGLLAVLISKNTPLDPAEIPALSNLLLEMGSLHTHFFFVDAATQFLTKKAPYTEDVKVFKYSYNFFSLDFIFVNSCSFSCKAF